MKHFRTPTLRSSIVTLALCALPMAGCQGLLWANLAALAVTVALFLGTLQLRRPARPAATAQLTAREGQIAATASVGAAHASATMTHAKPAVRG